MKYYDITYQNTIIKNQERNRLVPADRIEIVNGELVYRYNSRFKFQIICLNVVSEIAVSEYKRG